jgi:dTDP-4-dehydrorhamnose reductase
MITTDSRRGKGTRSDLDVVPGPVLVLGATGMLGHKLVQRLSRTRPVLATMRGEKPVPSLSRLSGVRLLVGIEAENITSIERAIDDALPAAVINCIGIIKQLEKAKDPVASIEVNALFPHRLARVTAQRAIRLIHFSTDCVFSGKIGNYGEDDFADADDLYGRSKYLGEVGGQGCLTLRSSIVGHELRGHLSLLDWFLSQKGLQVKGYARALYSGLTTVAMASLVERILDEWRDLYGIWQVSSEPISKYELLCLVNSVYGLGVRIERDETFVCDRRLDDTRFRDRTGWEPTSWQDMVGELHSDYTASHS